jgi:hypothetical protein
MLIGHGSIQEDILESTIQYVYLTCLDKTARENREPPAGTATTLISWEKQSVTFYYLNP